MTKKITPYQYAIFLYEITREKSKVQKMTKCFLEILAKNNDLGKTDKIVNEFEKYEKKQMGITEVELISAKPAVSSMKKKISELIKDGKLEIKENVNPDLVGGAILIVGDMMIDGSIRRKLGELRRALA